MVNWTKILKYIKDDKKSYVKNILNKDYDISLLFDDGDHEIVLVNEVLHFKSDPEILEIQNNITSDDYNNFILLAKTNKISKKYVNEYFRKIGYSLSDYCEIKL